MTDNLNPVSGIGLAVSMMKMKTVRLPGISHRYCASQMTVVIAREKDQLGHAREPIDEISRFHRRCLVMDQIAEDDQVPRLIVCQELNEPLLN